MKDNKIASSFLKDQRKLAIFWVFFAVLGRLIPHLPNVTPMTSLSLFAGSKLSRLATSVTAILLALLISDIALAFLFGYPIFSYWTIFTYTGFVGVTLVGTRIKNLSYKNLPLWLVGSTFGYWLWTNFGVWLTSDMYTKTFAGLINCYLMALPFLRSALLGDLIWGMVIFGAFAALLKMLNTRNTEKVAERY